MHEILSIVLGSMHTDLARVERVGMNLANVQTPGYKREIVAALPFASRIDAASGLRDTGQPQGPAYVVHSDPRAGTLKSTGRNMDLALLGEGWFEISTEHGSAYTRKGDFRLDARGRLVTQQGQPVLGAGGEIQLLHGVPVIDASGRVFEGAAAEGGAAKLADRPVAQLRILQFDRTAPMRRLGDGLVSIEGVGLAATEGSVQVQQGFLENANVSQVQEMVQLLQAVRHLESMQKVALSYDEMLAGSIRRLGEP